MLSTAMSFSRQVLRTALFCKEKPHEKFMADYARVFGWSGGAAHRTYLNEPLVQRQGNYASLEQYCKMSQNKQKAIRGGRKWDRKSISIK